VHTDKKEFVERAGTNAKLRGKFASIAGEDPWRRAFELGHLVKCACATTFWNSLFIASEMPCVWLTSKNSVSKRDDFRT